MVERASERPSRRPPGRAGGLRLEDLPPPDTRRWVARRKAQVVRAVRAGLLTLEQACGRYGLTLEEYASWERLIDRHGVSGLRVTRLQSLRSPPPVEKEPAGARRESIMTARLRGA
ncbi:DUF1153 domain-containing protein [Geminicoccaceae bacterium 1502E]|nr:DUF1153 domain-containing protein [Geminicoccaceae bacterium 1502E]